jgi:hypothetical protein
LLYQYEKKEHSAFFCSIQKQKKGTSKRVVHLFGESEHCQDERQPQYIPKVSERNEVLWSQAVTQDYTKHAS